ncbi:MAG: DUF1080 domain-containing protein [Candidatus Hydrogenedentes bacterium]|nr:DUF1080 domain-containing protein [Candidatus Hydrogenedentota bacterium]
MRRFAFLFMLGASLGALVSQAADPVVLFDGKDLSKFYTFLRDRGRDADPKNVFTVQDGLIRISGEEWGCITSKDEFANYELTVEFKWGQKTWGDREKAARDSGVLIHSIGEDGGYSGVWMHGIEVQMIEGGTGDLLVVGDGSKTFELTCPTAEVTEGTPHVYKQDGKPYTINKGRIDWWGRDPEWTDTIDFRGKDDVEKPHGEWNTIRVVARGNTIRVELNGVLVNEALDVKPTNGRIQVQSEGAEVFVRKIALKPLE